MTHRPSRIIRKLMPPIESLPLLISRLANLTIVSVFIFSPRFVSASLPDTDTNEGFNRRQLIIAHGFI